MTIFGNNGIRTFGSLSYGEALGTPLSTNGIYEFPPTYTLGFNTKPVMSDNGVSVKFNKNELTVKWYLPYEYIGERKNPGFMPSGVDPSPASIDTAIQQIKAILMQPRKTLYCTYQGLGPTSNNNNYGLVISAEDDLNFGPVPIDFKWKNVAAQRAVELTWVVVFHTHNQIIFDFSNNKTIQPTIFTELVWSRSYDIDELGSVTVTTNGKYSLAGNHYYHADVYRIVAAFPVPVYCQRVSQKFQHDSTGKSTTFTIVDKQHPIENPFPPKCLKISLSHEVSSAIFGGRMEGKGFHQWSNVIQGDITLPPGEPFVTAYFLFWFYARQRLFRTEKNGVAESDAPLVVEGFNPDGSPRFENNRARTIITKVSYKEALFDRTHNFRLEYVAVFDRDKLIQQSGLFTPLYNFKTDASNQYKYWDEIDTNKTDKEPWHKDFPRPTSPSHIITDDARTLYAQWEQYTGQFGDQYPNYSYGPYSAFGVYGYVGMNEDDFGPWVFYPKDQTTDTVRINTVGPDKTIKKAWIYETTNQSADESRAKSQPDFADLDISASYIAHENSFSIIEDVNTFQVARQTYDENIKRAMQSYNGDILPQKSTKVVGLHNMEGTTQSLRPSTADYVSSYNSQPITTILMSGFAIRAGFPPAIPSAFRYQGSSLTRSGQSIVTVKQIAQGRIPVYLATWSIPYYANTSVHTNFYSDLKSAAYSGVLT